MQEAKASQRVARRRADDRGFDSLDAALGRAGIDEGRFVTVAASTIDALRRYRIDDPATQLTDTERTALQAGGLDLSPSDARDPDPVADTAARYAALLADAADVKEVADLLGVTPARVRQRAANRTLFAVREGDMWRFPRLQFVAGEQVRGLSAVFAKMPADIHPVAVWRFLTEPDADLELDGAPTAPLTWLRSGGAPDPIVDVAREL